jgi:hypothetical protein
MSIVDGFQIAATRNQELGRYVVPKCYVRGTGGSGSMKTQAESIDVMAHLGRFERPASGSGDQHQNAMLMNPRDRSCTIEHGFVWYSAHNGLKSNST